MSQIDEIAHLRQEIAALEHSIEVRRAAVIEMTARYESMSDEERAQLYRWKAASRVLHFLLVIGLVLLALFLLGLAGTFLR